jgi:AcrR family transcriptional regulator
MKSPRDPVQPRAQQTVARILAAAAHIFGERGYAATTNEIAELAGVSIGSLYQYFRDKNEILVALHSRHLDQIERELFGGGPVGDPQAWLRWLVNSLITINTRPDAQVLWSTSRVLPTMRARVTRLVDQLTTEAATVLQSSSQLQTRAVIVTALAVVHEVALPKPTPTRRRVAVDAVLAVSGLDARARPLHAV